MRKLFPWLLATIAAFVLVLVGPATVSQARDITEVVGLDANSAVVKDSNGNVIQPGTPLPEDQKYTVNYLWSIPDGVTVNTGDTLTFYVPSNVKITEDDTFPMTNAYGMKIGTTSIAAGATSGQTVLNYMLTLTPKNRKGHIMIDAMGTVPGGTETTLAPVSVGKSASWVDPSNPTAINWTVDVLATGHSVKNPVIVDTLSSNQTYVEGSAKLVDASGFEIPLTLQWTVM